LVEAGRSAFVPARNKVAPLEQENRMYRALPAVLVSLLFASCASQEEPIRPNIQSLMASVPAGTARRACGAWRFGDQFAPGGGELLDLMGIQGASYVVKAPASQAGGCFIECEVREFNDGIALPQRGAPDQDVAWKGLAPATAWVVDILAQPDAVSFRGYSYHVRIRPLDGERHWQSSYRGFATPLDPNRAGLPLAAALYQCEEREVGLEKEVPLACLYQGPTDKSSAPPLGCGQDDAEKLARAARYGVVFCIRLRPSATQPGAK